MNVVPSHRAKRGLALAGMLAIGLALAMLIPNAGPIRPSRLAEKLPDEFGLWTGKKVPVGERELKVLAADTTFVRSQYTQPGGDWPFSMEVSLVFSGKDMNSSIHRPENCLRAQGWTFVSERYADMGEILPGEASFPVREIICCKPRIDPESKQPVLLPNGKTLQDWQVILYTFIGANDITPSHYGRTFRDIRDRVTGGYDQRWAYATFATLIPEKYAQQGVDLRGAAPLDEKGTLKALGGFMHELLPPLIAPAPGHQGAPSTESAHK